MWVLRQIGEYVSDSDGMNVLSPMLFILGIIFIITGTLCFDLTSLVIFSWVITIIGSLFFIAAVFLLVCLIISKVGKGW